LLFTALLSRALIPVGFMPGAGGIVLCSGYGPVAAMPGMSMPGMDMSGRMDHAGAGGPSQPHGTELCPFAAGGSAMAVEPAPPLTAFTLLVVTFLVFPPEKSIPRGTIVPTTLPRGPPRFA
jgi:hypothetical protein